MAGRKIPCEVAGFVDRRIFIVDSYRGISAFRWYSFVNDNHDESEISPWLGDSSPDDCPF
jgi:hypothetical protein